MLVHSLVAQDIVHNLITLTGTIPIWVGFIREELSQSELDYAEIESYLDLIEKDANKAIWAAEHIKEEQVEVEIDIGKLLTSIVEKNIAIFECEG